MPAPTNPKKRSLMPSGALRRALRAAGHHLDPVVQVGHAGVTDPVLKQLDQALTDHELVKVKVGGEGPEDRFQVAERLAAGAGAQLAQVLGRTLLLYRRHPRKPRFEPGTAPAEEASAPARRPAKPARPARRGPASRGPASRGPASRGPASRGPASRGPRSQRRR